MIEVVIFRLDELYQSARAKIVSERQIKVIGATTCAAASNRLFLEQLKPKIGETMAYDYRD